MAFTNIAYDYTNRYLDVVEMWNDTWDTYDDSHLLFTQVVNGVADEFGRYRTVVNRNYGLPASMTAGDTVTASVHGVTHVQAITTGYYGKRHVYTAKETNHSANIIMDAAGQAANGVKRLVAKTVFGKLITGFSDTIDDGASSTTAVFSAAHKYGSTPSSQSNLQTAALSRSTLVTALQRNILWRDSNGDPAGLGNGRKTLIVAPSNYDTALQLTKAMSINELMTTSTSGVTGAGALGPRPNDYILGQSITPIQSAWLGDAAGGDDDDWWLIEEQPDGNSPLVLLMPYAPMLTIWLNPQTHSTEVVVTFEFGVGFGASIGGAQGSNVA